MIKSAREEMKLKYKLLALDMDGTLLNSQKKISPRTANAIDELSKRGIYVVTSTGRNLAEILDYREVLRAMHFGILISGGMIFDFKKDTPVKVHGLDEKIILQLIDFGLAERAMIHLHTVRHSIAREDDIRHMDAFDFVREHPGEVIKVNLYHRSEESRDRNLARIKPLNLSISFAEAFNLEMSPANITKGSGLIELCEFLGLDISETVAIGDAHNDTEILQTAGLGIAMGNASDEIKKLADFVTLDNDSDGVAAAIEKFFPR